MHATYSMKDLAQSTGLSDRTLRNYLVSGILQGQKENGIWTFTMEQVEAFLRNDAVKTAVQAKRRAIVSDFWDKTDKNRNSICMVWDLPEDDSLRLMHFICDAVNQNRRLSMSFENQGKKTRIVLSGNQADVFEILDKYRHLFPGNS